MTNRTALRKLATERAEALAALDATERTLTYSAAGMTPDYRANLERIRTRQAARVAEIAAKINALPL